MQLKPSRSFSLATSSLNQPTRANSSIIAERYSVCSEGELKKLMEQSKKTLTKKNVLLDFFSQTDEIFSNKPSQNCRWDLIDRKYRQLHLQSKDIKQLFCELMENNISLLFAIRTLVKEKVKKLCHKQQRFTTLLLIQSELDAQLGLLTDKVAEFSKTLNFKTQNFANESRKIGQENQVHEQKIRYLEQENLNIKAQLSCKKVEIERLQLKCDEKERESARFKINQVLRTQYIIILLSTRRSNTQY